MGKLSDSLLKSLAVKTETYSSQLHGNDPIARLGREYLGRRKIGAFAAERYQLGIVADPLPGDEQHTGRLVIPYLTQAGVRAIKYRCIEEHSCKEHNHPKYNQPSGQEQRLYNTMAYFGGHARQLIGVCEGELDAIIASEHLGIPTMGVPGATQWDKQGHFWKLLLDDFYTVIVFADGDLPGKQLASKIAADAGPGCRVVHCDDGEDINSMVVAGKGDDLRRKAGL